MRRESLKSEPLRVHMKVPEEAPCDECCRSRLLPLLLSEGASRPADCGSPSAPPPWFRRDKFTTGQAVFHHYFLSIFVSNLVGLLCLLTVETIVRVLVFTGRSSTAASAYKRYLNTINHLRLWYSSDIFSKGSSAYKSIQLVRRMHTSSHSETQKSKKFITSQTDMVVTQWAFFGLVLTHGSQFGLQLTREEEEGLIHFWKTIGYLLGIEEKFNLAEGSIEDVKSNCHALEHKIIIPGLATPPPEFPQMADAMLKGIHLIVPVMDPPAFSEFTKHIFRNGHGATQLSWSSKVIFNIMKWNFSTLLHIPVLQMLLHTYQNFLLRFALFVCNGLPVIRSYYVWTEKKVNGLWQDIMGSFMKVIKGILSLFNLDSS